MRVLSSLCTGRRAARPAPRRARRPRRADANRRARREPPPRAQDVGGQDSIRPLWRHHFTGTQAVIYVVDCNDRERVAKASEELHKIILDHSMRSACLLVYANKSDLPHALSAEQIRLELRLDQLSDHAWHIQPSCATRGDGLWQGLKWLAANVKPL